MKQDFPVQSVGVDQGNCANERVIANISVMKIGTLTSVLFRTDLVLHPRSLSELLLSAPSPQSH